MFVFQTSPTPSLPEERKFPDETLPNYYDPGYDLIVINL